MAFKETPTRRGLRLSRPNSDRFFTVMFVFSHRTFRWSLARKTLLWAGGVILGSWALAMIGSAYGFWATKKLMSFSQLQQDTQTQQRQLRESLNQAEGLETEVRDLRQQLEDLMKLIDPKTPELNLPLAPEPNPTTITDPLPANPGPDSKPKPPTPSTEPNDPAQPPKKNPAAEKVRQLRIAIDQAWAGANLVRAKMLPIIERWNHTPSILPTAGYLSSGFGFRVNPFGRVNDTGESLIGFHTGLDICNTLDTPIQATADGVIERAGWIEGYGNAVVIRHSPEVETLYGHMHMFDAKTQVGQQVTRGDILGYMGRSGNATGVHLHYEVRLSDKPVNPKPYLRLQRQWLSSLK